jgi:O-antigen polymerase
MIPSTADNAKRHPGFWASRAAIVLSCTFYVVVFVVVYHTLTVPVWRYAGFQSIAAPARAACGVLLAIVPSLWMPIGLKRPSQILYWLLYLLVVVPVCLVPIYALQDQSSGPLLFAACIVAMLALVGMVYRLPLLPLLRLHLKSYEFTALLALLSGISYTLIIAAFGLHFRYVPLAEVYVIRSQFEETLSHTSALVAYAVCWQMYVVNPLLMVMGFTSRRVFPALAGALGQLAIYSISGFRDVLFSAAFLLYLLWVMRPGKPFGTRMALSWTAIFGGAAALDLLGYSRTFSALIQERMTGTPGLLTGYYYEFFSTHPKALLGHSIFKSFVNYPYMLEPRQMIGYVYYHDSGMSANANLWADAYANFGYAGILCFTLLLAGVMWLYDSSSDGRSLYVAALVIALPAFAVANSGLLTSLLTHGIGLAIVLMYLMPTAADEQARGRVPLGIRVFHPAPLGKQS